jgi:hypothetical protein
LFKHDYHKTEAAMRLLKFSMDGLEIFPHGITVDLYASDRVMADADDVHRETGIGAAIAHQSVIATAGLNATGKTTLLRATGLVINLVNGNPLRSDTWMTAPLISLVNKDGLRVQAIFENTGTWYLLRSTIRPQRATTTTGEGTSFSTWRFGIDDERLWVHQPHRLSKKELADFDTFAARCLDPDNPRRRRDSARETLAALGPEKSITATLAMEQAPLLSLQEAPGQQAPFPTAGTQITRVFDPDIQQLTLDNNGAVHLRFARDHRDRTLDPTSAAMLLSSGTVRGTRIINTAVEALQSGGYLLIDEIENSLNKKLVETIIGLFTSHFTNPHGATLIFTTHYPELLNSIDRTDNIYFMRRLPEGIEATKVADIEDRIDLSHADMFLSGRYGGTAPIAKDVQALRRHVRAQVLHLQPAQTDLRSAEQQQE